MVASLFTVLRACRGSEFNAGCPEIPSNSTDFCANRNAFRQETPAPVDQQVGKSLTYSNNDIGFSSGYPAELHAESAESLAANGKRVTDKSEPKYCLLPI
jgi:hypothetical protein